MYEYKYKDGYTTKWTCFNTPTYSLLENPKDKDKPSPELLNDPNYIAYCESILGGGTLDYPPKNMNNNLNTEVKDTKKRCLFLKIFRPKQRKGYK